MDQKLVEIVTRLEITAQRLEALGQHKPTLPPKHHITNSTMTFQEIPQKLKLYDEFINDHLQSFIQISTQIGEEVSEMGKMVGESFKIHRDFLWLASGQAEPNELGFKKLVSPLIQYMEKIANFKQSKKSSRFFNHLSAVSDGLQSLYWITVKPTPGPYVKEMLDVAMFYVNRVRTENKGNQLHSDWAKSWCDLLTSLQSYIRQAHTTGLVWNTSPGSKPCGGGFIPHSSDGGGAPGPPPPPPADLFYDLKISQSAADKSGADRQALFSEINKGEAITSGLRKVTADMQTHKNPALRNQVAVQTTGLTQKVGQVSAPGNKSDVKIQNDPPPNIYLKDGKIWNIEFQKGNKDITVTTDKKQAVYIYKCVDSVVQIKGKVNSVTIDSCKKTSVVFENLLAQVEVINSQRIEVQTLGTLPTISIQKTDGCQVYLSKDSLNAEIVTSKSSEMNVLVPSQTGDMAEHPIPEQFKTILSKDGKKLETTVSDII